MENRSLGEVERLGEEGLALGRSARRRLRVGPADSRSVQEFHNILRRLLYVSANRSGAYRVVHRPTPSSRIGVGHVVLHWASFVAALSKPDSWIERRYFDYRYGKLADVAREIAEGRDANEDLARQCGAHSIEVSVVANDVRIVTFWFPSGMTLLETELYLTSDRKLLPSGRQPVRTDDLGSWYLSDRYD